MKTNTPAPIQTNLASALPRRDFLKNILAAGAATAITPQLLLAANKTKTPKPKPAAKKYDGEKIKLACVGIGNRGKDVITALHDTGLATIVALCDTDMGAPHTQTILKKFPDVPRFQDFRQMFDKMGNQFEALSIAIPDHAHFAVAMQAMALGKHIYVEKPMAHSFRQAELMMAAAKKYNVVTQMGNQGHSEGHYFQFKAWTEAGIIKNVTRIDAYMNNPRRWHDADTLKKYKIAYSKLTGYLPEQPIPPTLDWNVWLMTALDHKYNKGYTPEEWRSWYDFGNGVIGDWGLHIFDVAHQFLDLGLPSEIDPVKLEGHNPFVFPQATTLAYRFPKRGTMPPLTLTWYDGINNPPPLPNDVGELVGATDIPPPTTGAIEGIKPGKIIYGEGLTFKGGSHGSTLKIIPDSKAKDMASRLPAVPESPSNHFANFLLACKGAEKTRSPFDIAAPLTQVMTLGVIAQRLNAKLTFDRATKQITNNKAANELLDGVKPRKGWEQYYKV